MTDNKDEKGLMAKLIGPKKQWRAYKARVKKLPKPHADAVAGLQRYLFHFGSANGASSMALLEDLITVFEQGAADGSSVRDIVGEDPVEFAEALIRNYDKDGYVAREQNRLRKSIDDATRQEA
jgi:DNA-binding ferritin-like protein (Dps family)